MNLRRVTADDYAEPLRGMILRGEIEPPDELVMDDRPQCNHWPGQERCLVCGMGVKPGESRYA